MNAPAHVHHLEPATAPAGHRLAQIALAKSIAARERCGIECIVARLFPTDQAIIAVGRAAAGVADTSTAGWAASLLQADSIALLKSIESLSAAAALAGLGTPVQLDAGASAVVSSVKWNDPSAQGAWVGEGGVIPVIGGAVAGARLTVYKIAGAVATTQELNRTSDATATMRQLLRLGAASLLDKSLFDAAAGVAFLRPPGLLAGVTLTPGSSVGGLAAFAADAQAMHGRMLAAGCGAAPVLICNSAVRTALSVLTLGSFGGLTVLGTPALAADVAVMIDAAYLATSFGAIEVDVSGGATLTMANADGAAPTQAMDAAGALGVVEQVPRDHGIHISGHAGAASAGFTAISVFQNWSSALRLAWPVGFAAVMDGAVQGVNAISWTTPTP